jgi:hypothetical protein
MKKVYFMVMLLSIFLLGMNNQANADCPQGWNSVSLTGLTLIGDCKMRIDFCYKCGVTGADPSNIKITFYGFENPGNTDCPDEIPFDAVWEVVRQYFMNYCIIPPCGETLRVVVDYPICKKTINVAWQDNQQKWHHYSYEVPCSVDFYYCQFVIDICYNQDTHQYQSNCIESHTIGDPQSCLPFKPVLPPPGLTWYENWDSDCYVAEECHCPEQ